MYFCMVVTDQNEDEEPRLMGVHLDDNLVYPITYDFQTSVYGLECLFKCIVLNDANSSRRSKSEI